MGEEKIKSYRKELWFNIPARMDFQNITGEVRECLHESGIQEGLVLVNAMHISASVFINDDERGLHHGYKFWLEALVPHEPLSHYRHNDTGEDNADAHIKRQMMGGGCHGRLGLGNRYFTVSLMVDGKSASLLKSSAIKL